MNLLALALLSLVTPGPAIPLGPGGRLVVPLAGLEQGETYRVQVALAGSIGATDRVRVVLAGPGGERVAKALHAGDPDLYLPFRPTADGDASLTVEADAGSGPVAIRV